MRRHSLTRASIFAACGIAAIGCSTAEHVDLGKTKPPGLLGASLTDYAGSWEGYAEAFKWSDNTDLVRLTIDANGHGKLQVGDPEAPAPDLNTGSANVPDWKPEFSGRLTPGFDYPIEGATVTSHRIRIGTSSNHVLDDWCGDFEPVPSGTPADPNVVSGVGPYSCIPNVGWSYSPDEGCRLSDEARTPVACNRVYCAQVCACTESSCGAMNQNDVLIDAALVNEGEELTGTLVSGERINIRMMRTP